MDDKFLFLLPHDAPFNLNSSSGLHTARTVATRLWYSRKHVHDKIYGWRRFYYIAIDSLEKTWNYFYPWKFNWFLWRTINVYEKFNGCVNILTDWIRWHSYLNLPDMDRRDPEMCTVHYVDKYEPNCLIFHYTKMWIFK